MIVPMRSSVPKPPDPRKEDMIKIPRICWFLTDEKQKANCSMFTSSRFSKWNNSFFFHSLGRSNENINSFFAIKQNKQDMDDKSTKESVHFDEVLNLFNFSVQQRNFLLIASHERQREEKTRKHTNKVLFSYSLTFDVTCNKKSWKKDVVLHQSAGWQSVTGSENVSDLRLWNLPSAAGCFSSICVG